MSRSRNLTLLFLLLGSCAAQDLVRIEAESYDRKVSDDPQFASAALDRAASGRHSLARFYPDGRVVYAVDLPAAGRWRCWLRYGARNALTLRVAVDAAEPPTYQRVALPATGGYVGPGIWGWAKVYEGDLGAGPHTLTVGSASFRLDCFCFTGSDQAPSDAWLEPTRRPVDAATQALLDRPLSPVRPAWLDGAADCRLPDWYDSIRVCAHTRLGPPWFDKPIFLAAGAAFASMGAREFARHIKSGGEGAWWPSAVGAVVPQATDRNLAQEIIDDAHRAGCRILVYHRHMEDAGVAAEHPDWRQVGPDGQPYEKRGPKICFNSPYADFVQQRLLELVDMGADGFYFDEVHMEKAGCWCPYCRRLFKEQTGLDLPTEVDPTDPVWHKLVDFTNASVERTFLQWRRALHARNPEVVMLVGSHTWPTMIERHLNSRLFRIADSMKTEFSLAARTPGSAIYPFPDDERPYDRDIKIALGYTLARDACDGRPAHIWAHALPTETAAVYATAGMIGHGNIANLDIAEATIPNPMFRPAFELGNRVSPAYAGTVPLHWALIHYSELARDRYELDPDQAWPRVLYPTLGAYGALLRAHLPVGILTDSQLEEGLPPDCQVLFLPAPEALTEPMQAAVARFKAAGGLVIGNRGDWRWHETDGYDTAAQALLAELKPRLATAPVRAEGGPEKLHMVAFRSRDGRRLSVSLVNDFSWVPTGRQQAGVEPVVPEPCRGVKVHLAMDQAPASVVDAVTGQALPVTAEDGGYVVALPEFSAMAVVQVWLR